MLRNEIDSLIANAMKSRDTQNLNTLKLIKCELVKAEKDGISLNEAAELKILKKMVAARKDAAEQYQKAGRNELAENELKEIELINNFMPATPSEEEITAYVNTLINELIVANGTVTMKDMKSLLSITQEKYPTADGKLVSTVLKTRM